MDCSFIGWCALKPEAQAAWVQAVGSVLGIATAIAIAWWQQRMARRDLKERDDRESIARHVRANRIIGRFERTVSRQLDLASKMRQNRGTIPIKAIAVPDDLRDLEGEMHLLSGAGGPAFTAINFFDDAQDLIEGGMLDESNMEKFIERLFFAQQECNKAVGALHKFLAKLG